MRAHTDTDTRAHRLAQVAQVAQVALNLIISSHCCSTPPVPGRADTTNPFGSSFQCSRGNGVLLPWSLHEPRQPCPPGDPDMPSALHPFVSLLAPVLLTRTMDGTTRRQLLGHQHRHADRPTPCKKKSGFRTRRPTVGSRTSHWNSRQRYSSGNRPIVRAA